MKRILKLLGYFMLGIFGLIILSVLILSFTGFPKTKNIETRNIEKASFGQVSDIMGLMSFQPVFYDLIRSEKEEVYFLKNGQPMILDLESAQINPTEKFIPITGLFGQVKYHDGFYFYLEENPNTEDRVLVKMEEASGKKDTLIVGAKGFYNFKLSPDGREILAVDQVDSLGEIHLYNYNIIQNNKPQIRLKSTELISLQAFGPQNETLIFNEILVSGEVSYYSLNLKNDSSPQFLENTDSVKYFLSNTARVISNNQAFTKDFNNNYFIRTGTDGLSREFNVIFELQGDSLKQISPKIAADVNHLELSPDDRFLVFSANSGGFGKIFVFDRKEESIKAIFDDEEFNLDWFKSKPFLITEDNQILYSISNLYGSKLIKSDLITGEFETLESSVKEDLKNKFHFSKIIYPTINDSIGIMAGIESYNYKPTKSPHEKMPVVIDLHGGPSMPAFPFQFPLGDYLIDKGIAVISPNFRGSAGYGVSFEASDNGANRLKQVEDIKALLDWIKTQPDLDAKKVLLIGASHGGYMVMGALTQYPGQFLGGMSLAGVSDFNLVKYEDNLHTRGLKHEFGDFSDPLLKSMIDSISPITYADRITEPLLLIHGTEDPRVVVENSDKMADAIESAGGNVQYIKLIGSGHGAQPNNPIDALFMIGATLDFIEGLLEDES